MLGYEMIVVTLCQRVEVMNKYVANVHKKYKVVKLPSIMEISECTKQVVLMLMYGCNGLEGNKHVELIITARKCCRRN